LNEDLRPKAIDETIANTFLADYFHPDSSILNMDPRLLFPIIEFTKWTSKPIHINFVVQLLKSHFFGEEAMKNSADITDTALVKVRMFVYK